MLSSASRVAGLSPSATTISWWPWQKPMHRRNMMHSTAPPWVPPRTSLLLRLTSPKQPLQLYNRICMPWTSSLMLAYGPGVESPRRLLNDLLGRERAARNGLCGASPARLPRRRPVGAEPGLKSRPCFYVPSLQTPCQARGARVAGYPASGPAEAAYSALCQLAHNCAKPRGRQFTFLSGVFAALPRCPCHTVHLTRTDPVTIIATIRPLAGASCRQSAPQPAPAGRRFLPSSLVVACRTFPRRYLRAPTGHRQLACLVRPGHLRCILGCCLSCSSFAAGTCWTTSCASPFEPLAGASL